MKKLIIISLGFFLSMSLFSQSTTNWERNIDRLEKEIAEQQDVIKDKENQISTISSDDTLSEVVKKKHIFTINREIEKINSKIEVSRSVIKSYQTLLEKEKADEIAAKNKAEEERKAKEKEAEDERVRKENAQQKLEEARANFKAKVFASSPQGETIQKDSY
ncbi:MAG: hypothetical protein ACK5N8_07520 [Alphaproteobacteria bacterium]